MSEPAPPAPVRGRPRSVEVDRAVLAATRDLLLADGYDALSIQAIARRAGVSRAAVYRRWSSVPMIVAEAGLDDSLGLSGSLTAAPPEGAVAVRQWLHELAAVLRTREAGDLVRALAAAAAASGPDVDEHAIELYGRFVERSRKQVVAGLRADAAGAERDAELVADALIGTVWHRVLLRRPLEAGEIDRLCDAVL